MNKIKQIFIGIIILLVFVSVAIMTYNLAEPKAYDFMTKHVLTEKLPFDKHKKTYGSKDIILVVIDNQTVEKYRWPWKRNMDSKIVNYFAKYAKPKLIIQDAILTSLDNSSPQSDKIFFDTIKPINNYIAGFMPRVHYWKEPVSGEKYGEIFAKKFSISVNDISKPSLTPYQSMISSPYRYLESVHNLGHVLLPVGGINKNISNWAFDNITRTNEYVIKYPNTYYPSIALKAYLILNPNSKITIKEKELILNDKKIKLLNKAHAYNN